VVGIIPWNSPFVFAAKKIAPALAFGNVSILKPARETPLSAIRLAELLAEAGAPVGVVQIVTGGPDAGMALVRDARADLIVFTGSDGSGRQIAQAAGANLTPVVMELGGKSPQLVFADADLDSAVAGVVRGIFSNAGQMCIAGSRVYAQDSVYPTFLQLLRERIALLKVGDPRELDTDIGPQATTTQQAKTRRMVSTAVGEGAEVVARLPMPADRRLGGGYFVEPTVLAGVARDAEIMRDEVFGPVMCIDTFTDERDAVARAHETTYGLAAGIWTTDVAKAHRMADSLRVGTVWINSYRVLADAIPFGGVGNSGFGREGGPEAVNLYTRVKSIWVNLAG
jgi:acyl-CoA reductase-like NAD-dependent aldehyde dehydrogenase